MTMYRDYDPEWDDKELYEAINKQQKEEQENDVREVV